MKLEVGRITCIEESDEIGDDDIYLVVFLVRAGKETKLNIVGPGPAWRNFSTGDSRGQDITLDGGAEFSTVYFVAMIECDNGKDIAGITKLRLEAALKHNFEAFGSDIRRFKKEAKKSLDNALGNDDIIEGPHGLPHAFQTVQLSANERKKTIVFKGDGAEYHVKFKMF